MGTFPSKEATYETSSGFAINVGLFGGAGNLSGSIEGSLAIADAEFGVSGAIPGMASTPGIATGVSGYLDLGFSGFIFTGKLDLIKAEGINSLDAWTKFALIAAAAQNNMTIEELIEYLDKKAKELKKLFMESKNEDEDEDEDPKIEE